VVVLTIQKEEGLTHKH